MGQKMEREMYFPKSQIIKFYDEIEQFPNNNLRIGQRFHQYMKLEKITGLDKPICDKIYEMNDIKTFKSFIRPYIDKHN